MKCALVMISRESWDENRAKVREHELTFPVVQQNQWEVSRDYAFFARRLVRQDGSSRPADVQTLTPPPAAQGLLT